MRSELRVAEAASHVEADLFREGFIAVNPHRPDAWTLARLGRGHGYTLLPVLADRHDLDLEFQPDGTVIAFPKSMQESERRRVRRTATAPSN